MIPTDTVTFLFLSHKRHFSLQIISSFLRDRPTLPLKPFYSHNFVCILYIPVGRKKGFQSQRSRIQTPVWVNFWQFFMVQSAGATSVKVILFTFYMTLWAGQNGSEFTSHGLEPQYILFFKKFYTGNLTIFEKKLENIFRDTLIKSNKSTSSGFKSVQKLCFFIFHSKNIPK